MNHEVKQYKLWGGSSLVFENFVTGKSNQLAHDAAIQVAKSPGTACNPLVIYGGVGLGKTHLLQAIGNRFMRENNQAKVCYVHATNYISDVVRAFQTKQFDNFKQYYTSLDLLLIDDIQFLVDKPGTQQEFRHVLNSLIDHNKQVVITCNSFPNEMPGFNPHLLSRLCGGLTALVDQPCIEMCVQILLNKSASINNPIGEDVAYFVAQNVRPDIRKDIRELGGALKRIVAFAGFHNRPITVDLAKEALSESFLNAGEIKLPVQIKGTLWLELPDDKSVLAFCEAAIMRNQERIELKIGTGQP